MYKCTNGEKAKETSPKGIPIVFANIVTINTFLLSREAGSSIARAKHAYLDEHKIK